MNISSKEVRGSSSRAQPSLVIVHIWHVLYMSTCTWRSSHAHPILSDKLESSLSAALSSAISNVTSGRWVVIFCTMCLSHKHRLPKPPKQPPALATSC